MDKGRNKRREIKKEQRQSDKRLEKEEGKQILIYGKYLWETERNFERERERERERVRERERERKREREKQNM